MDETLRDKQLKVIGELETFEKLPGQEETDSSFFAEYSARWTIQALINKLVEKGVL